MAREAGVSPTTVSRVFNRRDLVNDSTCAVVLDVVRRLQYVPNASARSLSVSRTRVLGLVLPLPYGEFFAEMLRGMDEAAVEVDYNLLIASSHNRVDTTLSAFRIMKGQVDGFIVISPNIRLDVLEHALPQELPAVFVHSPAPAGVHLSLCIDNRQGGYEATRHLIELGHRRIAVILGPEVNLESKARWEGYEQALAEAGIVPDPELVFAGAFTFESGVAATREILARDLRPTAIFAFNDAMALGVLHALQTSGVRVPGDVAVIGFDDIPSTRYLTPPLSTVHVPIYEVGRKAVEVLLESLSRSTVSPSRTIMIPTYVVPRASTLGAPH